MVSMFQNKWQSSIIFTPHTSLDCSFLDRLQNSIDSKTMSRTTLLGALSSLGVLRSTLHAYNRKIAEVNFKHNLLVI